MYEHKRLQGFLHLPTSSQMAHSLYGRIERPEKMCQGLSPLICRNQLINLFNSPRSAAASSTNTIMQVSMSALSVSNPLGAQPSLRHCHPERSEGSRPRSKIPQSAAVSSTCNPAQSTHWILQRFQFPAERSRLFDLPCIIRYCLGDFAFQFPAERSRLFDFDHDHSQNTQNRVSIPSGAQPSLRHCIQSLTAPKQFVSIPSGAQPSLRRNFWTKHRLSL